MPTKPKSKPWSERSAREVQEKGVRKSLLKALDALPFMVNRLHEVTLDELDQDIALAREIVQALDSALEEYPQAILDVVANGPNAAGNPIDSRDVKPDQPDITNDHDDGADPVKA